MNFFDLIRSTTTGEGVQSFIPDPDKSQVNEDMAGTVTFGSGSSYDVDAFGWSCILVRPTANATYYYNGDTTKTKTLPANAETVVWIGQDNCNSVTIDFGEGTAEVQAM